MAEWREKVEEVDEELRAANLECFKIRLRCSPESLTGLDWIEEARPVLVGMVGPVKAEQVIDSQRRMESQQAENAVKFVGSGWVAVEDR